MNARRSISTALALLCALAGGLLSCTPALAVRDHIAEGSFGSEGSGAGQFLQPAGVAVNESSGDVYVVDQGNSRVERFSAAGAFLAAWGWGVGDGEAKYEICTSGCRAAIAGSGQGQLDSPEAIAVDNSTNLGDPSKGDVYVTDTALGDVQKFSASGEYIATLGEGEPGQPLAGVYGVAVDPSGTLWIYQRSGQIDSFNEAATNEFLSQRTSPYFANPGFAVSAEDDLYVVREALLASKLSSTGESLSSEISPEPTSAIAVDPASGEVYLDNIGSIGVFTANGTQLERFGSGALSEGAGIAAVGSGPSAGEVYVADAAAGKVLAYVPEPLAQPAISSSATDVTSTSTTLRAYIDPHGLETTYYFQYGTASCAADPSACTDLPAAPGIDIGSEFAALTGSLHLQGLQPETTYYYRAVARNAIGTVAGPEETFRTQTPGGSSALPDDRQWELVSPADKHGAEIIPNPGELIQAAVDGSAISYYASGPFSGESSPSNLNYIQAFSRRGPNGWSTQEISSPHDETVAYGNAEFPLFSSDLSLGIVSPLGHAPLAPEATERTIYVRDDATGSDTPLVTPANTLAGAEYGGTEAIASNEGIRFITATPDLKHIVLLAHTDLTAEGDSGEIFGIDTLQNFYEWTGGTLRFITIPPVGTPEQLLGGAVSIGGFANGNTRRAISEDGTRVFWSAGQQQPQLYMRDLQAAQSVRVSEAQGVSEPEGNRAEFQIASSDGSSVFFTDSAQLTTTPGGGLYMYDAESGALSLLTVPLGAGEAAGVQGMVLGASEDASTLYFVASGVLSDNENGEHEKAGAGANNLYVLQREGNGKTAHWRTSFIARLADQDAPSWSVQRDGGALFMGELASSVSQNGRYLAFMSSKSLTGQENRDAQSGLPDAEVYLYDATAGKLVCASCNPSGASPEGLLQRQDGEYLYHLAGEGWNGQSVSAALPTSPQFATGFAFGSIAPYQPRYLSDSGRLFFDSRGALVPADVNGTEDVYEYDPEGLGSCRSSTDTADEQFDPQANGCVALISGGAGPDESVFADASANGEDVFFATSDRLVPEDVDNAYDLYDAHACSSQSPCFAPPPAEPPACDSGDSCKPAPSPQPTSFGPPSSATFSGAGNLAPQALKPATKKTQKAGKKHKTPKHKTKRAKRKIKRSKHRAPSGNAAPNNKSSKGRR